MDLDNIKQTWSKLDKVPSVDEQRIEQILNNEGKDALARLGRYEKFFLWMLLPAILINVIFYYLHIAIGAFYSVMMIVSLFWQIYKIRYLRSIDLSNMSVMAVSKSINTYKKYIYGEIIIGVFVSVLFFVCYISYALPFGKGDVMGMILSYAIAVIFTELFLFLIYSKMYVKNIRALKKSIAEIEDMENED